MLKHFCDLVCKIHQGSYAACVSMSMIKNYSNVFILVNNNNNNNKYASLASTHIFCPLAIETADAWHETAIEVTQEIGQHITVVTEDNRET